MFASWLTIGFIIHVLFSSQMWPANNSAGKKTPGGAGTGTVLYSTVFYRHGKSLNSQLLRMIATRNQNSPQTRSTVTDLQYVSLCVCGSVWSWPL